MKGPPPKPVELRRAEGNPAKRALPQPTVVGGREKPKPPAGLTTSVRRLWRTIAEPLHEAGIFDQVDAHIVTAAAVALDRALTAGSDVERRGMLVEIRRVGRDGSELVRDEPNPSVRQEREAWMEFRHLADRLGIGPAARARLAGLGVEGKDVGDQFDELAELREARTSAA